MRIARLRDQQEGPVFCRLEGSTAHLYDGAPWSGGKPTGKTRTWTEGDLECPVEPRKIVCIGRNYAAHAKELSNEVPREPLLFFKPSSALLRPGGTIVLPWQSAQVEHEAELGVIIGKPCRNVSRDDALANVFGYTCVADITARDLQKKDHQWTRAKGFDTFCPVGPWIETSLDATEVRVACRVRGELRQEGSTLDMLFDIAHIVAYISEAMTLEAGDLIATGTPPGVGLLADGDDLEIEIENIGVLRAAVVAGPPAPGN
jgi:2-keto-4-pentenoate hydratase/2-oxohepta-3-ene-1,7-dioic acid hydratase in catechol pathway